MAQKPRRQGTTRSERRLGLDELAAWADVAVGRVHELIDAGILRPDPDGLFVVGDVDRIRIVGAFASAGVPLEVLARASRAGTVSFDYYDELHPEVAEPSDRTFGELKVELGDRAPLVERLLTAFGLAPPEDDGRLPTDDERLLLAAADLIGEMADAELALRVVRLLGEGARRTSEAALDVYGLAADAVHSRAAGLPNEEIYERYLAPWSRLARLAPALSAWLHGRHLSAAIDAYSVDATELVLERAGFVAPRQASPPAVAFVDLTGFTRLSEERGDQAAASSAMQLATLADEAARRRSGRVVKLLGDGALLRFSGAVAAVEASLEILEGLSAAELPSGHAGVDAGPLVVREGDIFGRTVNLAARLSDRARPGEVLVSESVAVALPTDRFRCEPQGRVELQGVPRPVAVFSVSAAAKRA